MLHTGPLIGVQRRLVVGTRDTELELEIKANLPFYGDLLLKNEADAEDGGVRFRSAV